MSTILQVEQGGTGVQTVAELKTQLDLKEASHADISNNYEDTSQSTVPSSYALSEALQAIAETGIGEVVPIEKGGTGATTAEEAIRNLGIQNQVVQFPIQIANGGTGATDAETALNNLGISLPLPIESGGTGGISVDEVVKNLFGGFPIPVNKGGTGGTSTESALFSLGLGNPISVQYGGTGGSNANLAKKKLELNKFFVNIIENNTDLNNLVSSGIYVTQGDYVDNIINAPTKDAAGRPHQATLLVMSNYDYNTSGDALTQKIITQIMCYSDSTETNLRNRLFIRCTRTKNGQQQPWSPWEEIIKGKSTAKSDMNFFVNGTTGSDVLDPGRGLTAELPFKTVQAAINYVCGSYEFLNYNMHIWIAPGTYKEWVMIPNFGTLLGQLVIHGSGPEQAIIRGAIICYHAAGIVVFTGKLTVQCPEEKFPGQPSAWFGIIMNCPATINVDCCIDAGINNPGLYKYNLNLCEYGGVALILENANFIGNTTNFIITTGGVVGFNVGFTINGTIVGDGATVAARQGGKIISWPGVDGITQPVIHGSVTGKRFFVDTNAQILIGGKGMNYFPGTVPGVVVTETGGLYL